MVTVKFYNHHGKLRILEAVSVTMLRDSTGAEVTLHQKDPADDKRYDVLAADHPPREDFWPEVFQRVVVENSNGRTTEMFSAPSSGLGPTSNRPQGSPEPEETQEVRDARSRREVDDLNDFAEREAGTRPFVWKMSGVALAAALARFTVHVVERKMVRRPYYGTSV